MVEKAKVPARCHEYIKVGMEPAVLILKLVQVYLQVSGMHGKNPSPELHAPFLEAVARDGRSFRPDVFHDAVAVVKAKYPSKQDALSNMEAFTKLIGSFVEVGSRVDPPLSPSTTLHLAIPNQCPLFCPGSS